LVERVLVATDGSTTATRAVDWAAEMARRYEAELIVLQVLAPEHLVGASSSPADQREALGALARRVGGEHARARLELDSQPADTIVQVAAEEQADIIVVGNLSMRERTEFLLGSVPNRVSHTAPCSVVIVNTADGDGHVRRPAPSVPEDAEDAEAGELLGRAAQIARVLARYKLQNLRGRADVDGASDVASARRLRQALEELGPTFAKLGQILSTRPDLLPAAFAAELADLQDHVTPLTESEVVSVMEQELRVPWEDVFADIEAQPMAAGTIAQVHRAVLVGGARVVVKVQRPEAQAEIMQDLGLLRQFAAKAAGRPAFTEVVDVSAIVEHLSSSLQRELDFRHEAANLARMREVLEPFDRLAVPEVYSELSSARLLVMEEIDGVPVGQAPEGEARREAGRQLLEAYYQQVLGDGFFHADPHPGNMLWAGERIYLLDLGMVGEVDADLRRSLMLLLLAFWREDVDFLADLMVSLAAGPVPFGFDASAFRAELGELVSGFRHLSLKDLRLGPLLQQLTEMSLRHGIRLPAELALIGKAFGQMQTAAAEMDPSLDPFSVAAAFYMRQLGARLRDSADPRQFLYEAQKLRVRAEQILEGLERTLGARAGPGLRVEMPGDTELTAALARAGKRMALGLVAATAVAGAAISASAARPGRWRTSAFGGLAAGLTGALVADVVRRR
jgi:predicted unusual protein kinase regulating ubiquinone biosynthesis (AarF/ABC1/UbiB family)/nucleotide-binding universal stress UspA family protein